MEPTKDDLVIYLKNIRRSVNTVRRMSEPLEDKTVYRMLDNIIFDMDQRLRIWGADND